MRLFYICETPHLQVSAVFLPNANAVCCPQFFSGNLHLAPAGLVVIPTCTKVITCSLSKSDVYTHQSHAIIYSSIQHKWHEHHYFASSTPKCAIACVICQSNAPSMAAYASIVIMHHRHITSILIDVFIDAQVRRSSSLVATSICSMRRRP